MDKEIVTKDKIAMDFKNSFFGTKLVVINFLCIFLSLCSYFLYWLETTSSNPTPWWAFVYIGFSISWLVLAILESTIVISMYYKLKKGHFRVQTDLLTGSSDRNIFRSFGYFYKSYTLNFQKNGKYRVPEGKLYRWSKNFSTDAQGVYNRAIAGDTFYVVAWHRNYIIAAYNTRLFEYKGELCDE